jgi:hypothetical protein
MCTVQEVFSEFVTFKEHMEALCTAQKTECQASVINAAATAAAVIVVVEDLSRTVSFSGDVLA